jgi:hypothetical protein
MSLLVRIADLSPTIANVGDLSMLLQKSFCTDGQILFVVISLSFLKLDLFSEILALQGKRICESLDLRHADRA